jgi:cyclophilin family peptidyl-prolyl cis-trans isomerase
MYRPLLRSAVFLLALLAAVGAWGADSANPAVTLKTNLGSIEIELYPENAPVTVRNFLQYVKDGHYDGTIFHRVIDGFMIQGGGFTREFREKPTRAPIKNEAGNGLRNEAGMVAMARTSDPNSATAQFFINLADNDFLDFRNPTAQGIGYCVFGKVIKGMDVVRRIAKVRTHAGPPPNENVPVRPVVIERAEIVSAGARQPNR